MADCQNEDGSDAMDVDVDNARNSFGSTDSEATMDDDVSSYIIRYSCLSTFM
jgi:hypothetical protein